MLTLRSIEVETSYFMPFEIAPTEDDDFPLASIVVEFTDL